MRSQLLISKITAIGNKVNYLHSDFVVSVSLIADAVCNGVDYVNLQKVCRSGVCIVQGLFLAGEPFGGIFAGHFSVFLIDSRRFDEIFFGCLCFVFDSQRFDEISNIFDSRRFDEIFRLVFNCNPWTEIQVLG